MKIKMKAKLFISLLSTSLFLYSCSSNTDSDIFQAQEEQDYISYTLDLDAAQDLSSLNLSTDESPRLLNSLKKEYNDSFGDSEEDYFSFSVSGLGAVGTKQDVEVFINKKNTDNTWTNVYRKRQQWEVVGDRRLKYGGKIEIPKVLVSDTDELQLVAVIGQYTDEKDQKLRFFPYTYDDENQIAFPKPVVLNSQANYEHNIPFLLKVGLTRTGADKNVLKPLTSANFQPQGVLLVFLQDPGTKYRLGYGNDNEEDEIAWQEEALTISYFGEVNSHSVPYEETGRDVSVVVSYNDIDVKERGLAIVWLPNLYHEIEIAIFNETATNTVNYTSYRLVKRGNIYAYVKNY